jgi:hypothetical protein
MLLSFDSLRRERFCFRVYLNDKGHSGCALDKPEAFLSPGNEGIGTNCTVIDGSGSIRYTNGSSFSTPIVAGLGICLWQALPQLNNPEIINLIQRPSSQYDQPDAQSTNRIRHPRLL